MVGVRLTAHISVLTLFFIFSRANLRRKHSSAVRVLAFLPLFVLFCLSFRVGTISFRDKAAASSFLETLGNVVAKSVKLFHEQQNSHHEAQMRTDLVNISRLLHHFEDNVEGNDGRDREVTRESALTSSSSIDNLCRVLDQGRKGVDGGWSDNQRDEMASQFKHLFEHLVILMQLSEYQQSKGTVKNIRATQKMLGSVYNTDGRISVQHNRNLRDALQVLIRAADNRASVTKESEQEREFHEIASSLRSDGKFFCDWVDGSLRSSQVQDITKRNKGVPLEQALERFLTAVEVRILSEADFSYRYFDRLRFASAVRNLEDASRRRDQTGVVEAARDLTASLKEAEIMQLAEEAPQLKLEVKRMITDAQKSLGGDDSVHVDGSLALESMDQLVEEEKEIKGKPLKGQLPNAIQSMAVLLNSSSAQNVKPREADGKSAYGEKQPVTAPKHDESQHATGPGFGIIAETRK